MKLNSPIVFPTSYLIHYNTSCKAARLSQQRCRQRRTISSIPANPSHPSILSIDFIFPQRHPAPPIHFLSRSSFHYIFSPLILFKICPVSPILVAHNQPMQTIARRSAAAAIALNRSKSKLYAHCVDAYVIQYVARK